MGMKYVEAREGGREESRLIRKAKSWGPRARQDTQSPVRSSSPSPFWESFFLSSSSSSSPRGLVLVWSGLVCPARSESTTVTTHTERERERRGFLNLINFLGRPGEGSPVRQGRGRVG